MPDSVTSPAVLICNHIVKVTNDYTGRGPTKARAHINEDLVTVVLQEILLKGERSLVADGRGEEVLRMRRAFQDTMQKDYVAGIEQILGRKVSAFLSANHLDPDVAIESFMLHPVDQGGAGRGKPAA
ncbi:MAG: hypothetical protein JWM31_1399 [Solirubrobacterales bacterium]|nr:hypothetical protein [Solirubrobacterales bacterium]